VWIRRVRNVHPTLTCVSRREGFAYAVTRKHRAVFTLSNYAPPGSADCSHMTFRPWEKTSVEPNCGRPPISSEGVRKRTAIVGRPLLVVMICLPFVAPMGLMMAFDDRKRKVQEDSGAGWRCPSSCAWRDEAQRDLVPGSNWKRIFPNVASLRVAQANAESVVHLVSTHACTTAFLSSFR
jgi:hypothetical protein